VGAFQNVERIEASEIRYQKIGTDWIGAEVLTEQTNSLQTWTTHEKRLHLMKWICINMTHN
jgi:hypothetical protein